MNKQKFRLGDLVFHSHHITLGRPKVYGTVTKVYKGSLRIFAAGHTEYWTNFQTRKVEDD